MPDGRILIAAYDVALKDLTVRFLEANAAVPGPVLYVAGFEGDAQALPGSMRGNLGVGPDVGAELDVAIADNGTIGIVARDRTMNALRLFWSKDGEVWTNVDVDTSGVGGRAPDIEARSGGGWVIAYQGLADIGGGDYRASMKIATTEVTEVFASADFSSSTLDAGAAPVPFLDLPGGTGSTPSLAQLDGRWFVSFYDADAGSLKLGTWAGDPGQAEVMTLLEPSVRGDIPGGATGLAPKMIASDGGVLDIAFVDVTSGELRHLRTRYQNGVLEEPVIGLIDGGLSGNPQRFIALDAQLSVTPGGQFVVVYQDSTLADLYVARGAGEPLQWSLSREDAEGSTGFFPQAVHQGQESILIYGHWSFPRIGKIEQRLVIRSL